MPRVKVHPGPSLMPDIEVQVRGDFMRVNVTYKVKMPVKLRLSLMRKLSEHLPKTHVHWLGRIICVRKFQRPNVDSGSLRMDEVSEFAGEVFGVVVNFLGWNTGVFMWDECTFDDLLARI